MSTFWLRTGCSGLDDCPPIQMGYCHYCASVLRVWPGCDYTPLDTTASTIVQILAVLSKKYAVIDAVLGTRKFHH
jgi:hypothetical protein